MSWLLKSLQINDPGSSSSAEPNNNNSDSPTSGFKEDLSVLSEAIGRQFRGVAAFLAPPPPSSNKATATTEQKKVLDDTASFSSQQKLIGIRNDLAEIGEGFKSGISKFASNLLQFGNDNVEEEEVEGDDYDNVPGITEEVIDFVKEISLRPEFWCDFPLSLDNDFKMSDDQREHALTVEHLVPSLAALRVNLHRFMEDGQFWIIYFILLLPRLNEHDFELLSTPKIVETRNALLQKLKNKKNAQMNNKKSHERRDEDNETKGDNILPGGKERRGEDVSSEEEDTAAVTSAAERLKIGDKENTKQFLDKADIDAGASVDALENPEHGEDVSFSDLEDDDSDLSRRLSATRQKREARASSPNESTDWVQLNESSESQSGLQKARQSTSRDRDSEGESSDWLAVDDFD